MRMNLSKVPVEYVEKRKDFGLIEIFFSNSDVNHFDLGLYLHVLNDQIRYVIIEENFSE